MKVERIEFIINQGAGELSYRNYNTDQQVEKSMYVIISKLLANDDVFFKLYQMNENGANLLLQKTVPFTQFPDVLKALEADLQKKNPAVKLVETMGDRAGIAIGPNGAISSGTIRDALKGLAENIGARGAANSGSALDIDLDVSSSKPTGETSSRLNKFMQ